MKKYIQLRFESVILSVIFCVLISIPFIAGLVQEDLPVSAVEKRNLAKFPSIPDSIAGIIEYPKALNLYYSDHFGYREKLTKSYFKLIGKFGDQTAVNDVTIGRDGWLFLGSIKPGYDRHGDPMAGAINTNLYTSRELERFATAIMAIKTWLKDRGIEYIYVTVPDKHKIYFEMMPEYIVKQNDYSATDQLVSYLKENTDVTVVDLRPVLFEEKQHHQLYYKYDTHWNFYGANVAQFEIMKQIEKLFPGRISPALLSDDEFDVQKRNTGDLKSFANVTDDYEIYPVPVFDDKCQLVTEPPDFKPTDVHTMICDTEKLNAVIFRDSYFEALKPYFARKFNRSTYIWGRLKYDLLEEYVNKENPDIVIDEVLDRIVPYQPAADKFVEDW